MMKQPHIALDETLGIRYAILPGDPARIDRIKAFLEDEEAVEECRRGLRSKIDQVREMDRQLAEFIEELKEKLRKGERA